MNVKAVTPILNVSSLAESFTWFEKLGWHRDLEWGDPPSFGAVACGHARIFLCQDGQGARGGPMPREPWDNEAGSVWMSWWLESPAEVDAVYAQAEANGFVTLWPPTDMPWHVRECHIRHPDGHTFRVSAGLPEE